MKYSMFNLRNFRNIPQIEKLPPSMLSDIETVGNILPFRTNNYVIDNLIDWQNYQSDPLFLLTFPQREMVSEAHYQLMSSALKNNKNDFPAIKKVANKIHLELNPHPAGQMQHNTPNFNEKKLLGIQHKYDETLLFFPSQGQTCHAFCTFCFRWPQFSGMEELKFAMKQTELLIAYLKANQDINDVLFTGGDPMIMTAKQLDRYVTALLQADLPNLRTIRIGTKSLTFWPYRFTTDKDSDDLMRVFEKITKAGIHLAIMSHFNHHAELQTPVVRQAIKRILSTGAQIRTQSPILNHINANADLWSRLWQDQVSLGMIPYYMFVVRNTGAQKYFALPLDKCWEIFREAYSKVSGIARTVRGPSMSADPGKVHISGVAEIRGEKVYVLDFIQGRNPAWVGKPFFAKYNPSAIWLDDLEPAFGEKEFFYQAELEKIFSTDNDILNNYMDEHGNILCA